MSVRFPGRLHDELRREAYERRVAMNAILIEMLEARYPEPAQRAPDDTQTAVT